MSQKNVLNQNIELCCTSPMTGFYRDGFCKTGKDDLGTHTVCAKMTKDFLEFTKSQGNDLYSVVKPGDNWCLCEYRWFQAYLKGKHPKVFIKSTNNKTKKYIIKEIMKTINQKGGKKKMQFL